jgi:hypothetical protein
MMSWQRRTLKLCTSDRQIPRMEGGGDAKAILKARLKARIAERRQTRTGGSGATTAVAERSGRAEVSMEQLQKMYAEHNGSIEAMVAALGMPTQVADFAREYADTPANQRDVAESAKRAAALLRK